MKKSTLVMWIILAPVIIHVLYYALAVLASFMMSFSGVLCKDPPSPEITYGEFPISV